MDFAQKLPMRILREVYRHRYLTETLIQAHFAGEVARGVQERNIQRILKQLTDKGYLQRETIEQESFNIIQRYVYSITNYGAKMIAELYPETMELGILEKRWNISERHPRAWVNILHDLHAARYMIYLWKACRAEAIPIMYWVDAREALREGFEKQNRIPDYVFRLTSGGETIANILEWDRKSRKTEHMRRKYEFLSVLYRNGELQEIFGTPHIHIVTITESLAYWSTLMAAAEGLTDKPLFLFAPQVEALNAQNPAIMLKHIFHVPGQSYKASLLDLKMDHVS